jgi:hypothetical protein
MDLFTDLGRALEQGLQNAGTFLETNSALLANTLALDKLSEFDGTEVRLCVRTAVALRRGGDCPLSRRTLFAVSDPHLSVSSCPVFEGDLQ